MSSVASFTWLFARFNVFHSGSKLGASVYRLHCAVTNLFTAIASLILTEAPTLARASRW